MAAAISEGSAQRFIGVRLKISSDISSPASSIVFSSLATLTKPGLTALTLMFSEAYRIAAFLVTALTTPLLAWYAADFPKPPDAPKILETLTIEPE